MSDSLAKEEQMSKDLETSLGIQMDAEKQINFDLDMQRAVEADRAASAGAPPCAPSHEPHEDTADSQEEQ